MILELKVTIEDKYLIGGKVKGETIKLFGLGDCEVNRHSNSNVYRCRIEILESHFNIFYGFAKALKDKDTRKAFFRGLLIQRFGESYGSEFLKEGKTRFGGILLLGIYRIVTGEDDWQRIIV